MGEKSAVFDFHGVRVRLHSREEAALADLRRDFAYFAGAEESKKADIALELRPCQAPAGKAPGRAFWRWRSARITQKGSMRTIDYQGRALLEYDLARESGLLHCGEPA